MQLSFENCTDCIHDSKIVLVTEFNTGHHQRITTAWAEKQPENI